MNSEIDYNDRYFRVMENEAGDVDDNTIFHYRQNDNTIWASYMGGEIKQGALVAKVFDDGYLEIRYHHITKSGQFRSGKGESKLEVLFDGRYRLYETWEWIAGESGKGESVVEEFIPSDEVSARI